jgi:hypothetical protein
MIFFIAQKAHQKLPPDKKIKQKLRDAKTFPQIAGKFKPFILPRK